jgi:hypothetical protein
VFSLWDDALLEPHYYNVMIDWHLYQFMFPQWNIYEHVYSARTWELLIEQYRDLHPVLIGEWSMGTGSNPAGQPYVDACVEAFKSGSGWYLWNWKIQKGLGYVKHTQSTNEKLRGFGIDQGLDPLRLVRAAPKANSE